MCLFNARYCLRGHVYTVHSKKYRWLGIWCVLPYSDSGQFYPYPSWLCNWLRGNHTITPVQAKQTLKHDDIIKWKHFPRYWPFVWGIHRSPHKGQWRGALTFSLICAWTNSWVNNRDAGDLRPIMTPLSWGLGTRITWVWINSCEKYNTTTAKQIKTKPYLFILCDIPYLLDINITTMCYLYINRYRVIEDRRYAFGFR